MAIQIRRGNFSDLDRSQLQPGEFAAELDQLRLLLCFTAGSAEEIPLDKNTLSWKYGLGVGDLDMFVTPGIYSQTVSSHARTANHYPVEGATGTLVVVYLHYGSAEQGYQYYLVQSSNEIYYRRYVSSAWTDWVQLPAVEQGTSGIWTYRKYADGTAECWGTPEEISVASINSEWNGMYHYEISSGIAYPTGLFVARPVCTVGCHSSNFPGWIREVSPSNGITTAPGLWACTVASYTATTTMMFRPSYHAIGRWK